MTFKRFEEIEAWQTARKLAFEIQRVTNEGQFAKDFRLRDQINQAAVSMMANIAEGHARRSDREFAHFLFTAKSSAAELESHLYVALDRGYLDEDRFRTLFRETERFARQVSGLITFLTGQRRTEKQTG